LVALPNDRFILRRESPVETLGGGLILDPWAQRIRKRNKLQAIQDLQIIEEGDPEPFLRRAGIAGLNDQQMAIYGSEGLGRSLGNRWLHQDLLAQLEQRLLQWLKGWHQDNPLASGCPRGELSSGGLPHLDRRAFESLIQSLTESKTLVAEGPRVRLSDFSVQLSAIQEDRLRALETDLLAMGCATPKLDELMARDSELIPLLMSRGKLQRVGDRLVHTAALDELTRNVRAFFESNSEMGPTEFKAITGLSRRHAIPLLEWLDAQGVTRRQANFRVLRNH